MTIGNRIMKFFVIISTIVLLDLIHLGIAEPADNTRIMIDENLKIGMPLKDAIDLLGSPEKIQVSQAGTSILLYDTLGLSIEVLSDGTRVEGIHLLPSFRGQFASGLEIGSDSERILSVYDQPDIMTEDTIEYSDMARVFHLHKGRLVGADLYSGRSISHRQVSSEKTGTHEKAHEEALEGLREELREEVRQEVRQEIREEVRKEVRQKVLEDPLEGASVFEIFGFEVKGSYDAGIVVSEIRPDSAAESGGLKVGERIRKVYFEGHEVRNIYAVGGLKQILQRAIRKGKKDVYILQNENHYHIVEVPTEW
ncbi:MAG: PDZ domain-containing protein [Deltaproteobacteria bacterium]|nr:PDZ domain-containing protein [Deltaproteobacteria bacterium]